MDEQRLERALRQGPPFSTAYVAQSPALRERPIIRGPVSVSRLVVIVAVTALLLVGMLASLFAIGTFRTDARGASNGWVAFSQIADLSAGRVERDIYLVREGLSAQRIIGSDVDDLDQICPAFSPEGGRLAYGEAQATADEGYRNAALVVSEVDAGGNTTEVRRIEVGGSAPPPCAVWSADGRWLAFGVPVTSPINPGRSAAGSAVWVASAADGTTRVLADLLATDLEWSPVAAQLAIASGDNDLVGGERLRDGTIRLYDAGSGQIRTLATQSGVTFLTWSPDGRRIAYQRSATSDGAGDQEIWVAQIDGSGEYLLAHDFGAVHGIGPVWSPTGDRIVYQRCASTPCSGERHEVVLVTPDGEEVVLPPLVASLPPKSTEWRPWHVGWSPDGRQLLYTAWANRPSGESTGLIARPLDPGSDPVVLLNDPDISAYDGEARLANQAWGRLPDP